MRHSHTQWSVLSYVVCLSGLCLQLAGLASVVVHHPDRGGPPGCHVRLRPVSSQVGRHHEGECVYGELKTQACNFIHCFITYDIEFQYTTPYREVMPWYFYVSLQYDPKMLHRWLKRGNNRRCPLFRGQCQFQLELKSSICIDWKKYLYMSLF